MNKAKAYWKLAVACRTPLVFCLDQEYTPLERTQVQTPHFGRYIPEIHDCDDFAFALKGHLGHGVGVAFSGGHAWNVLLCTDGVWHVEPQTGAWSKRQNAACVII